MKTIVGLGELLWDRHPEGDRLGGAPANFAVMAGRLGNHAAIAGRLGGDALGVAARALLATLRVDSSYVQSDAEHPTGTVSVTMHDGEPEYVIHKDAAWDHLAFTPEWRALARSADAVCFGTLAQRSAPSRQTVRRFLEATRPECLRVFDINLRDPFFSQETIRDSLALATAVKMNAGEFKRVLPLLGLGNASGTTEERLRQSARRLLDSFPLKLVCLTLGPAGSLLIARDEWDRHPGVSCQVADTVGAGDAFTAAMVHHWLQGAPLRVLNEAGNRWGAWVASNAGAMPDLSRKTLDRITHAIAKACRKIEDHGEPGHAP